MNDFTVEKLCNLIDELEGTIYTELRKKIQRMIDVYCEHDWRKGVHLFNDVYCTKCKLHFEVNNQE